MPAYVLDASALTALFQDEPGGPRVEDLIYSARSGVNTMSIAVVNLGEVLYTLTKRRGAEARRRALRRISMWPLEVVDADFELTLQAAILKSGHNLGYMDAFAVALARRQRATLLATDTDFERVLQVVKVEFLPHATR